MLMVLTSAGQAAQAASPNVPLNLISYKLGSTSGYLPSATDTGIRGLLVHQGTASSPLVVESNLTRYSILLDASVGPFEFGEVGLYLPGDILFAIGSFSTTQFKKPVISDNENVYRIDCFVSAVGTNYAVFSEATNSKDGLALPTLPSIDNLPSFTASSKYNLYACNTSISPYVTTLASNQGGLWTLTGYEAVRSTGLIVNNLGAYSLTLGSTPGVVNYTGELVFQVTGGEFRGTVREIQATDLNQNSVTFATPILGTIAAGTPFVIYERRVLPPSVTQLLSGLDPTFNVGLLNQLIGLNVLDLIRRDGSVPMNAALSMSGFGITNVREPVNPGDATPKGYVDQNISTLNASQVVINNRLASLLAQVVLRNGQTTMIGNLSMGNNRIVGVANPSDALDAVNLATLTENVNRLTTLANKTHNQLSGIQGGDSTDAYHLTLSQQRVLDNLTRLGYPQASFTTAGIVQLANTSQVSTGSSAYNAVQPSTLIEALRNTNTPTTLQHAVMAAGRKPMFVGDLGGTHTVTPGVEGTLWIRSYASTSDMVTSSGAPLGQTTAGSIYIGKSGYYRLTLGLSMAMSSAPYSLTLGIAQNGFFVDSYFVVIAGISANVYYRDVGNSILAFPQGVSISLYVVSRSGVVPTIIGPGSRLQIEWVRPL